MTKCLFEFQINEGVVFLGVLSLGLLYRYQYFNRKPATNSNSTAKTDTSGNELLFPNTRFHYQQKCKRPRLASWCLPVNNAADSVNPKLQRNVNISPLDMTTLSSVKKLFSQSVPISPGTSPIQSVISGKIFHLTFTTNRTLFQQPCYGV